MSGNNWRLVADEPVEFEKEPVDVQDFTKFNDHSRGICRMYLKWWSKTVRCKHVNWLDLESLGSWPTLPKNFLGTDFIVIIYHHNRMNKDPLGGYIAGEDVHHHNNVIINSIQFLMLVSLCIHAHCCMMRNGTPLSAEDKGDKVHHKSQSYMCSVPPVRIWVGGLLSTEIACTWPTVVVYIIVVDVVDLPDLE